MFNNFGRDLIPPGENREKNFRNYMFAGEHLASPLTGFLIPPIVLFAVGSILVRGLGDFFRSKRKQ